MGTSISVVMAVHNGRPYLDEQLRSVIAELHPSDELIVVDDASTDGSPEWLASVADARLQLVRQRVNQGVRRTFENGLRLATKEFVFLCDHDDVWLPGKRQQFIDTFLANPRALVVVSDAQIIDAAGIVKTASFMASRGGFKRGLLPLLIRNRYLGCAMALRRSLLSAVLPIPRMAPMHDMWIGAIGDVLGDVHYLPTPLLLYRRHSSNVSPARHQGLARMLRWRGELVAALAIRLTAVAFRRIRGQPPPEAHAD